MALALGMEKWMKLRQRKPIPSSHGQMTGGALHRVSLFGGSQVALTKLDVSLWRCCIVVGIAQFRQKCGVSWWPLPVLRGWEQSLAWAPFQQLLMPCVFGAQYCRSSTRAVSLRCQNSYISKKKELNFMPDLEDSSFFMLLTEYQTCLLVCFIHKLVWRQFFFFKVFFFKWIVCSFDEVVPPPGYTSVPHYAPVTPLIYKLW